MTENKEKKISGYKPEEIRTEAKNKKNKSLYRPIIILVAIAAVLTVFITIAATRVSGYANVFPNIYINGVSVEGKSADELLKFLNSKYSSDKTAAVKIDLNCGTKTEELNLDSLDIKFNNTETVSNVMAVGNIDNSPVKAFKFIFCKLHRTDIDPVFDFNTDVFSSAVSKAAEGIEIEPVGITFELNPNQVVLHKQTDGFKVDRDEALSKIKSQISAMSFNSVTLEPKTVKPEEFDFDKFYSWLTSDAEDAYYEKNSDNHVVVHPEKLKCIVEKDVVKSALEQLKTAESGVVTFDVTTEQPQNTAQKLQETLYADKLSSYSTGFGGTAARVNNVRLAANRIDGYELMPDEEFSYDKTILPRKSSNGYQSAPVYVGNKVESGMGGGICQPSSTLYCAALYANLEITERHNHSLMVSYLPPGLDATIAEGVLDLKFKNSTGYPIKISASASGGVVTFSIWGYNPEKYSVELLRSGGGYSYYLTRVVKKDGTEVLREKMASSQYNKPEPKKEDPPKTAAPNKNEANKPSKTAEPGNAGTEKPPVAEPPAAEPPKPVQEKPQTPNAGAEQTPNVSE